MVPHSTPRPRPRNDDGAACHCRRRAPAIAVRGLEHAHGSNVSYPRVSPLSALGRSSPSGSFARRSKNAPLAVGPFAAASILDRGSPCHRYDRQGNADRRSRSGHPSPARHDRHSQRRAAHVARIVRKRLRCSGSELGRVAGAHRAHVGELRRSRWRRHFHGCKALISPVTVSITRRTGGSSP